MLDENSLFREVTLRICGHLDLSVALRQSFDVLSSFLPLTSASLQVFERDLGAVRVLTSAPTTDGPGSSPSQLAGLSGNARRSLDETAHERVTIVNRPATDPVSAEVSEQRGDRRPVSILILRLGLSQRRLGALILLADGGDRFTPEHARIMEALHEPFAIALSHALRHEEAERLREQLADDNRDLQRQLRRIAGDQVVGADFGLREAMDLVRRVAPSNAPVLLLGETGSGKEVIADVIHQLSSRAQGQMVRVNCGALPDTLVDSELFGHEKGAFTGATAERRGRFERANGGTIFLDEIGELPLDAQTRLLRVLQNGEYERVGGTRTLRADVRVVAATHRDLDAMVSEGKFRADLRFRLNVFPIRIPPLRERKADIAALTHHFLDRKARELNLSARPVLGPGAIDQLTSYDWPGNVRELQNVIERALLLAQGRPLEFPELGRAARASRAPADPGAPPPSTTLDEVTAEHIRRVLAHTAGRIEGPGGAAELLGVNQSTLRHRLRKLGIPFGRGTVSG